jgi:glycosyltransferase involved in cell wall biosynthesis
MKLNGKDYPDTGLFEKKYIEEYCNLEIYPKVNEIETEAGLLSDFAEAFATENNPATYHIFAKENLESSMFFKDCLLNFVPTSENVIGYIDYPVKHFENFDYIHVLLAPEHSNFDQMFYKKVKVYGISKVLYLSQLGDQVFKKYFWYYLDNGVFKYSNLVCYTMIVKNGGPLLEQVLTDNLPIIDRWCILDTGSTDGTQDIIKRVLGGKKGMLYEEPFVDFKVSRNRCLELAKYTCKFILMLDDTYAIRGDLRSFLNDTRGDQFSDSFSLLIQSDDTEYYSNRIIKSKTNLRYIHTIHEVINNENNINVTVPCTKAVIFDYRSDYMEQRTTDRKQFDLQLLFKEAEDYPDDPRALYYIAQTYGCIGDELGKAEYFEKRIAHPVQGYVQEKIDACFELARCYNFKISPVTKEPLNGRSLTLEEWKICERLYLQSYSLDQKRPDSLYFIGVKYYLQKEYLPAYRYFKMAFEVGYPINSQYSLKPTLSYHFLPKFLAEVCYYFSDFSTGLNASALFLGSSKFNNPESESWNTMSNWYRIYTNLIQVPKVPSVPKVMDKKIFCIVTDGGWGPWTGKDIETKGMGGSETWIIEMARYISRTGRYHVVVFCNCNQPEFYENVGYNPIGMFHTFIATTEVEHCIISRYTEYIPVSIHTHAKNVGIIFHDNLSPELIIPVHPKLKWVWGLTEWHSTNIKTIFPQFDGITNFIHYGVDQSKFHEVPKIKNSFIYSSFPNRGLVVLLKMWPKIIKRYPEATLNIFCDLEQDWVNQVAPEQMKEIKALLKVNTTGVTNHGWVPKEKLSMFWNTTEYWLYPCIFEETFCLTALEAAISKTCVISNNLAALSETVGDRGIIIHGDPRSKEWQEECLTKLFGVIESEKKELINLNYQWAKKLTWESQADKFLKFVEIKITR